MVTRERQDWQQDNKASLIADLERLRHLLKRAIADTEDEPGEIRNEQDTQQAGRPQGSAPTMTDDDASPRVIVGTDPCGRPASPNDAVPNDSASNDSLHDNTATLHTLCTLFNLTAFERDLLLLCAGIELDSEFSTLCAAAQNDPQCPYPTFSLALAVLPDAYWEALTPDAPLRHWQLIKVEESQAPLTQRALHIDERILHYLVGVSYLDKRLTGLFQPLSVPTTLVPSQQKIAERIATTWHSGLQQGELFLLQLCGSEVQNKQQLAATASALISYGVCSLLASTLPNNIQEASALLHLWEREALLSRQVLLLLCDDLDTADSTRLTLITHLVDAYNGLLIISSRERHFAPMRPLLTFEVDKPTREEQLALWVDALDEQAALLNGSLERLTNYFQLSGNAIQSISTRLHSNETAHEAQALEELLWEQCRVQTRPRLEQLAQRIETKASWQDLILPDLQCELLHDIVMQVRQRSRVYDSWGFRDKSARGLGINALFSGASGVGKTLAAEVVAHELHLDLYRIDLSAVVSKYIGETEKNLRQIFDAAEESSVILLFDEADALFGKRGEVKDSHDRYANIEVSYLLQRMESYHGLAILTTNMKDTLDSAFLRRIRFLVQFPFPDATQRAAIWRCVFPPHAPTDELDYEKLAQLHITGGNIHTIALSAAFYAANAAEPIRMQHILRAVRHEYAKLERSLTGAELRGWQ